MRWLVVLVVVILTGACSTGEEGTEPSDSGDAVVAQTIELPPPVVSGGGSLVETLAQRRSVRDYGPAPLELAEVSQLLWAAQGVTSSSGNRTAPSAGGLYPLELYLITTSAHYHYDPHGHQLEVLGEDDLRRDLSRAALSQEAVEEAAAVVIITAEYGRTEKKYGNRAERYVQLEAGHAAQNVLLQAVSLGLGAVPIGAFHDAEVQEVLGLPPQHEPLYLIPVGDPVR